MAALPPSGHAHCSCDCLDRRSLLIAEINRVSEGLSGVAPPMQLGPVPLDVALFLGRRLALEWERMNGCLNVEDHLNLDTLSIMETAIERVLKLYEALLGNTYAHQPSGAAGYNSSQSPSTDTSRPSPHFQANTVKTSLGTLDFGGEEARIVAQEALRHMISRLGEMLKDIEEESGQSWEDTGGREMLLLENVKMTQQLMLRLLGRVPR